MNEYCVFKVICSETCIDCFSYSKLEKIDYKEYIEEFKIKGDIK